MPFREDQFETAPKLQYIEQWSGIKHMLDSGEPTKFLLPELNLKDDFLTNPGMLKAIDGNIALKEDSLRTALQTLGIDFSEQALNKDLETSYMESAKISVILLTKMKEKSSEYEKNSEEISQKTTEIVEEAYNVPGLGSIVEKADIIEPSDREKAITSELPEKLNKYAEKKILCDFYIQGKSLNDLGGLYSYLSDKDFEDTAIHRAFSSALQLTNTLGSFIAIKKQLSLDSAGNQNVQLGRVKVGSSSDSEGAPIKIEASGTTPSELTHEISKGLLEYVMLDGSVPAKGEISEEEAQMLQQYLERPSVEYFEFLYGAPLARCVDDAFFDWIEDFKKENNKDDRRHLERTLDLRSGELNSNPDTLLRFMKLVSLLSREDLAHFYEACLNKNIPVDLWKVLEIGKGN